MPGFKADHVGSLLRPQALLEVRAAHERGEIGDEALKAAEDKAVLKVLQLQREAGVEVYTDGEFRRESWLGGLYAAAVGLVPGDDGRPRSGVWQGPGKDEANRNLPIPPRVLHGRLKLKGRFTAEESGYLAAHAPGPFKVTMPGPTMYTSLYRQDAPDTGYPDRHAFLAHLVELYQAEVEGQTRDGAAYVQLDSLRYTHVLGGFRARWGDYPAEEALDEAVRCDNAVLAQAKAGGAVTGVHMCRGNHRSAWAMEGGYEPIAERVFAGIEADRLLLEFDDARSGGFEPLRFVPRGKTVVLGLVTTKTPELEDKDHLRRRVDEASKYVPLEHLALSPQCGFASTYLGNLLTEDDEKRKLQLVAETARSIWG